MRVRVILCVVLTSLPAWCAGREVAAAARPEDGAETPDLERLGALVRDILLGTVPLDYENTKQWGRTKEVWDGLRVSRDGLRIRTKRRTKQVNHGTWKRYHAWLVAPREELRVDVASLRETDGGRVECQLVLHAPLEATARLSEWRLGVQLFSFSVHAQARVTVRLRCDLGLRFDFQHLPPDVLFDPVVRDVRVDLDQFRLLRISDADGPLVRELGDGLRGVLQDELDQRRGKLTRELNDEVDKHRQQMRLSMHALSRWERVEEWLEERAREAEHAP